MHAVVRYPFYFRCHNWLPTGVARCSDSIRKSDTRLFSDFEFLSYQRRFESEEQGRLPRIGISLVAILAWIFLEHEGGVFGQAENVYTNRSTMYPATTFNDLENIGRTNAHDSVSMVRMSPFLGIVDERNFRGSPCYLPLFLLAFVIRRSVWRAHTQRCQTLQVWSLTRIERFVVISRLRKGTVIAWVSSSKSFARRGISPVSTSDAYVPVTSLSRLLPATWASSTLHSNKPNKVNMVGQG